MSIFKKITIISIIISCFLFACDKKSNFTKHWPTKEWKYSSPEAQGMDSVKFEVMLEHIDQQDLNFHSITVIRNGYIVFDAFFPPYSKKYKHKLHSATKSIISLLMGIALNQKYITNTDITLKKLFPDRKIQNWDKKKEAIKLHDLLTMRSGIEWNEWSTPFSSPDNPLNKMIITKDWSQFALDQPMLSESGIIFNYNSGVSHVLSQILYDHTKILPLEFAKKNLFEPLGIQDVNWETDPNGLHAGGWGLQLKPHDMAKIGYLLLNNGKWENQQIISESWIKQSTQKHVSLPSMNLNYGYLWWIANKDYYYASGRGGQFIIVDPEKDIVTIITSGINNITTDEVFDIIYEEYIRKSVVSNEPIGINKDYTSIETKINNFIKERAQKKNIISNPIPKDFIQKVNGKKILLEKRIGYVLSITLYFENNQIFIEIEFPDFIYKGEIGMNGEYIINPPLTNVPLYNQYSLPVAFKGYWHDDALIIYQQYIGDSPLLEIKGKLIKEDKVSISFVELAEGWNSEVKGIISSSD